MSFDLGVRAGILLPMTRGDSTVFLDQFVGVKDGKIAEICAWEPGLRDHVTTWIDAQDDVVLPGLVNGHTHLAMTLFRGLEDDAPFDRWLFGRILPLEARLVDAQFVRLGTELAALECIRFGVTTVNDMYFFPETIADTLDRAGLRGWVGQVWSSGSLPDEAVLGRDRQKIFERFLEKYGDHPRITPALAPHAPYTCNDVVLTQVVELSKKYGVPIHTHVAETSDEVVGSQKQYGKTPVQRLWDLGILTPRTLAAHCVHLDEADTRILAGSGASVAYNPDSNLKLSSGIAPIVRYREHGIPVAFGTDGAASNNDLSLFGAMNLGTKLQKLSAGNNTAMVAADALRCATWEGARALGLEQKIGSLAVGKDADWIVVSLNHPHLTPLHDVRSALVYAAQGLEVETVVCRGRVLMRDRNFLTLDQERILLEVRQAQTRIQEASRSLETGT